MSPSARSLADRLRNELQVEARGSLSDVFREEPPPLDKYLTDRHYMNGPMLSEIQYDAVRHAEQILLPETYIQMVEEFGPYWAPVRFTNEHSYEWGKGSGKDHICRCIASRGVNILECMHSPLTYFGLPTYDSIHILNVASSSTQAHRAFFKPLVRMMKQSPFFLSRLVNDDPGDMASTLLFKNNVECISGHSLAASQEGLNLIIGIADEISEFRTEDEIRVFQKGARAPSKAAETILKMMRSSARTRFSFNMKIIQISYPRFLNDAIQQATTKGLANIAKYGEESRYYVSGPEKTWVVNPRYEGATMVTAPHDPTYEIPVDYLDDYRDDPVDSMAKYECRPPKVTGDTYFRNTDAINETFRELRDPEPIEISYWWGISELQAKEAERDGTNVAPGWNVKFDFAPDFRPIEGALYCMHGDIGINTDAAGLGIAHCSRHVERVQTATAPDGEEIEQYMSLPVITVDAITSFSGDRKASHNGEMKPRDVQIRWYRELCFELIRRGFHIVQFTYDGFQSTDSMQILERRGINAFRVSTDMNNNAWNTLRDVMYDGRLEAYYRQRVVTEIKDLVKLPNGKIDHTATGSKDEADALAAAVLGAVQIGGSEAEERRTASPTQNLAAFSTGGLGPKAIPVNVPPDMTFDRTNW